MIGVVGCALAAAPLLADEPLTRRLERDGLKLELAPLASDQVVGFFLGRGFSKEDAEHIAMTGCVFRSAIGNSHQQADAAEVRVALPAWRIIRQGATASPPRTREDWEPIWNGRKMTEDAATAFFWALFPTEQTFAPTDHNWGFLTFGLPPGASFDLELRWRSGGTEHSARMEGLACGT